MRVNFRKEDIMFKKKLVAVGLALSIAFGTVNIVKADDGRYHDGYSKAAIITDKDTGRIIYSKNADTKRPMASMTKIMTLLLTFDAVKEGRVAYDDMVKIEQGDVDRLGTNIKLVAGEEVSLEDLLNGLMIVSANDAALAISRYVGGSYSKFVEMMNNKAKEVGMVDTVFYNPNGLPVFNGDGSVKENTTTAQDVLELEKWMYKHYPKQLTEITSKKRLVLPKRGIDSPNTNPLLPIMSEVDGVKTGYTTAAGYCLAYSMKMPENRIFGVTMGAGSKNDRKMAAYTALEFIKTHFKTKMIARKGEPIEEVLVNNSKSLKNKLVSKEDVAVLERTGENYSTQIKYKRGSLKEDNFVAELIVEKDGEEVSRTPLYLQESVKDSKFTKKAMYYITGAIQKFKSDKPEKGPILEL